MHVLACIQCGLVTAGLITHPRHPSLPSRLHACRLPSSAACIKWTERLWLHSQACWWTQCWAQVWCSNMYGWRQDNAAGLEDDIT